jgi:uncharacterized membrane protein
VAALDPVAAGRRNRSILVTGILLGIGLIASIDEALFHQLLQWHTLYWGTDQRGRILSDGLLHVLSTGLLLWGTYRLWRTPDPWLGDRRGALLAAILIGAGAFNLYDGIVQHVGLHLHLVNEYVCSDPQADNSVWGCPNDVPFEVAWIVVALALLVGGGAWWRRAT